MSPDFTACIEPDPALRDLKDLGARHAQLTQMIAAERNRDTRVHHFFAKRSIDRVIDALQAERKAVEREMQKIIDSVAALKRRYEILISIPGIGPLTALTLLHSMPELGRVTDRQIAALAGVAPMNSDSGKNTGRAHLRGGRKHVRQMLYMAAMAAKRFNPKIKAFFDRLIKNGKPRLVALAACMRKLLIIANVMVEKQELWQKTT